SFEHLAVQPESRPLTFEDHPRPRFQFLSWMHQRLPDRIVPPLTRDNLRVSGVRALTNQQALDGAGFSIERQQTRRGPLDRRFLGDQFRRKLKVELADVHPPSILAN